MTFTTDTWVSNHSPKIALKLHAMGVVTLEWNMCEAALLSFFFDLVALPPEEAWVLFSDLGDIAISERIRSLLKAKGALPEAVAAIDNILQFYENCRLNRNQLTHFEVDKLSAGEYLLRRKSKKRDVPLGEEFSNKLEDIRAVADDIKVAADLLWIATVFLEEYGLTQPAPWPPIRELPKLLWSPPQPIQPKPPRPPRSSAASRRSEAMARKKPK